MIKDMSLRAAHEVVPEKQIQDVLAFVVEFQVPEKGLKL